MPTNPRFVIINTCDAPCRRMVTEYKEGGGYCYMARSFEPDLKAYDGMTGDHPTAIEKFGFRVDLNEKEAVFTRVSASVATYEDGAPRDWQDRVWPEQFALPLVGTVKKRKKR